MRQGGWRECAKFNRMNGRSKNSGSQGFTLLEVMITLVVLAVLVLGVAPSLADFVKRNRAAAVTNDVLAAFQYARSEALARGSWVIVCRRPQVGDADAACTDSNLAVASHCSCATATTSSTADGWEDGWLVVADADRSQSVTVGDNLLRVAGPVGGAFTVRGNANVRNQIEFEEDATLNSSIGSLFVCGPGTDTALTSQRMRTARQISVSLVGHATVGAFESGDNCFPP